jgi:putative FmdB family regulatory protein
MPIYEYRCNTCGESFERLVRFSETEKTQECPSCQSEDTQKQLTMPASFGFGGFEKTSSKGCNSTGRFT